MQSRLSRHCGVRDAPCDNAAMTTTPESDESRGTRINKYIGETGYCSRREADALIGARRVAVNGQTAGNGTRVMPGDEVRIDGQVVRPRTAAKGARKHTYIAFYKPVGVTCTTESEVRGNIVDFIGHEQRIFPIGRLDKDSEGLILLSSKGDIVNEILRAENAKEKEYLVGVSQAVTEEFLRGMARGVPVHGEQTKPCRTSKLGKYGFRIILTQGLNRQIRLMAAHFGYRVKQLVRVRIVNIKLAHLKPGQWRNLTEPELRGLLPTRSEW
jgi:23S rRNA pseudouridine2604 synthase